MKDTHFVDLKRMYHQTFTFLKKKNLEKQSVVQVHVWVTASFSSFSPPFTFPHPCPLPKWHMMFVHFYAYNLFCTLCHCLTPECGSYFGNLFVDETLKRSDLKRITYTGLRG